LLPDIVHAGLEDDQYQSNIIKFINVSNQKRDLVKGAFLPIMNAHFRRVADICRMTKPDAISGASLVREGTHMAKSIENDPSDANIKRLCWMLYFSSNTAYKSIFGMDMSEYCEMRVMDQMKVCYEGNATKAGKGCVSQYINRKLNKYRCNVIDAMMKNSKCAIARVCSNSPAEWEKEGKTKPKVNNPHYLFWVGTKKGEEFVTKPNGTMKKTLKVEWEWVSEWESECLSMTLYF
jgi:hypothetical protein